MADVVSLKTGLDTSDVPRQVVAMANQAQAALDRQKLRLNIDTAPLGRISGDLRELDRSLTASNSRVIAFGATTGVLYSMAEAFRSLVSSTIETEKELTNIQSILHTSTQGFSQLRSSLFDIAATTASSFKEVAAVAADFARQGLGLNQTLQRTRDALILARETGIDAKQAYTDLTAAVNTFSTQALDSTTIINKLVAVSTNFAVTSADLAEGIKRAGATAQESKVSFDQLVGAIAAIKTSTGRDGASIGTSLQRVFSRIDSAPALKALENIGVRTRELTGEIRPATDILHELADKMKTLDEVTRNQVLSTLAGRVQFNQLNALLKDYSRENSIATASTLKSAEATNEAIKRNEELNTTLSALINKTRESGTALASAFGEKTIGPALSSFLKTINSGLDSVKGFSGNDSIGSKIGSGIVDGIGVALKGPGFVLISALLLSLFKKVGGAATQAIGELAGLNKSSHEQEATQVGIARALSQGNGEYAERFQLATTTAEREQVVLDAIKAENAQLAVQRSLYAEIATSLRAQGTVPVGLPVAQGSKQREFVIPEKSRGYIPNASDGLMEAMLRERHAVSQGAGGASSAAKPVVVPDFSFGGGKRGTIVANTHEYIVKNYGGGDGSAVFNPRMVTQVGGLSNLSKLGRVERVASDGLVPNFANISAEEASKLLKSKNFQSITYQKANGELANYHAAQHHVRRDLLVGAGAPQGYKNWTDFDEKTNSLVLRNTKEGEEEAKFRRFSLKGIKQIRANGQIFDILNQGFMPNFAKAYFPPAYRFPDGELVHGKAGEMHMHLSSDLLQRDYKKYLKKLSRNDMDIGFVEHDDPTKFLTRDEAHKRSPNRFGDMSEGFIPNFANYGTPTRNEISNWKRILDEDKSRKVLPIGAEPTYNVQPRRESGINYSKVGSLTREEVDRVKFKGRPEYKVDLTKIAARREAHEANRQREYGIYSGVNYAEGFELLPKDFKIPSAAKNVSKLNPYLRNLLKNHGITDLSSEQLDNLNTFYKQVGREKALPVLKSKGYLHGFLGMSGGFVPNFAPGQLLPGYQLSEELGSGGFGKFFKYGRSQKMREKAKQDTLRSKLGFKKIGGFMADNPAELPEHIQNEYAASSFAHEQLKDDEYLHAPRVIGSLQRSLARNRVGKEVVGKTLGDLQNMYSDFHSPNQTPMEGKLGKIAKAGYARAGRGYGIRLGDGAPHNIALTGDHTEFLKTLEGIDNRDFAKMSDPELLDLVKNSGNKLSLIDTGYSSISPKYLELGFAEGFVPALGSLNKPELLKLKNGLRQETRNLPRDQREKHNKLLGKIDRHIQSRGGGYDVMGAAEGLIPDDPDELDELIKRGRKNLSQNQRTRLKNEAVKKAQELGVYKPGMSGYDALRALRQHSFAQTPAAPDEVSSYVAQSNIGTNPIPEEVFPPTPAPASPPITRAQRRDQILRQSQQRNAQLSETQRKFNEIQEQLRSRRLAQQAAAYGPQLEPYGPPPPPFGPPLPPPPTQRELLQQDKQRINEFFTTERGRSTSFGYSKRKSSQLVGELQSEKGKDLLTDAEASHRQFLSERTNRRAFAGAFLAPIVGQAAIEASGVDPNSQTGRTASGVLGGISTGVSVATLGGGPVLGGIAAGFLSLKAVLDNTTKSFEEVSKAIDESNNKRQTENSNINAFNQSFSQLVDLRQNNGDPRAIQRATTQTISTLGQVPIGQRKELGNLLAVPTSENLNKAFDIANEKTSRDAEFISAGEAVKRLTASQKDTSGIRADFNTLAPLGLGGLGASALGYRANLNIGGIAGDEEQIAQAYGPNAGAGGFLRRRLVNATLNLSEASQGNFSNFGRDRTLQEVTANAPRRSSQNISKDIEFLKGIPLPDSVLKETNFDDLIKQALGAGPGKRGDSKAILQSFLEKSGLDPVRIKEVIDRLPIASDDAFTEVVAFLGSKANLKDLTTKVEASANKYNKSFKDFLDVSGDILKDVAANFNIDNLKESGQRDLALKHSQGLLRIAAPTFTPTDLENREFVDRKQGLDNDQITSTKDLLKDVIGKFDLTKEGVDNPEVAKALATAAANISKNPLNAFKEFTNIGDSISKTGSADKGLEALSHKLEDAGKDFARRYQEQSQDFINKYKEANQEHALKLLEIQTQQQRNFLGGDFRKLPGYDFSTIDRGLASATERGTTSIVGNPNPDLSKLNGNDILSFHPGRESPILRSSGSSFDDFFHGGVRDLHAERDRAAERGSNIVGLGEQLQDLGLLDNDPAARKQFAAEGVRGGIAAGNNFLNDFKERAHAAGQDDLVELAERNRSRLPAAIDLQMAEKFHTGVSTVGGAQLEQQRIDAAGSDIALASLDPLKSNTAAVLQSKASIIDLMKSVDALTKAEIELKDSKKDRDKADKGDKGDNSDNPPPPLLTRPEENKAHGFVPNFSAFAKEMRDIKNGVGGARLGDTPYLANIQGLGNTVVNTGEKIVRNFANSGKDAVLNRDMQKATGFIPNFADDGDDEEGKPVRGFFTNAARIIKSVFSPETPQNTTPNPVPETPADDSNHYTLSIAGKPIEREYGFFSARPSSDDERGLGRKYEALGSPEENEVDASLRNIENTRKGFNWGSFRGEENSAMVSPYLANRDEDFSGNLRQNVRPDRPSLGENLIEKYSPPTPEVPSHRTAVGAFTTPTTGDYSRLANPDFGARLVNQRIAPSAQLIHAQARSQGFKDYFEQYNYNRSLNNGQPSPHVIPSDEKPLTRAQLDLEERRAQQLQRAKLVTASSYNYRTHQFSGLNDAQSTASSLRDFRAPSLPNLGHPANQIAANVVGLLRTRSAENIALRAARITTNTIGKNIPGVSRPPAAAHFSTPSSLPHVETNSSDIDKARANLRSQIYHSTYDPLLKFYNKNYHPTGSGQYRHLLLPTRLKLDQHRPPNSLFDSIQEGGFATTSARGFIPNFAYGINDAINREAKALTKRGVPNPHDYIFVGNHGGITGVGNTIDERSGAHNVNAGISEGVNRYLKAGLNPRAAGQVPNYADDTSGLSKSFDTLTSKLIEIVNQLTGHQKIGSFDVSSNQANVQHTGKFNVDVNLRNDSGGNSLDKSVQETVSDAVKAFSVDLNNRLKALEKKNGILTTPPVSTTTPNAQGSVSV